MKHHLKFIGTSITMAVSIFDIMSFFKDEDKSVKRGENHFKSGHVEKCTYSDGQLNGLVRASMRNRLYQVSVSS